MPIDDAGQRWACHSCIRGHRARECKHFDRWMLAVKKPGRPANCPHGRHVCDCESSRMVIMVAIPRTKPCQCKASDDKKRECTCANCSCVYETRVSVQDLEKMPRELLETARNSQAAKGDAPLRSDQGSAPNVKVMEPKSSSSDQDIKADDELFDTSLTRQVINNTAQSRSCCTTNGKHELSSEMSKDTSKTAIPSKPLSVSNVAGSCSLTRTLQCRGPCAPIQMPMQANASQYMDPSFGLQEAQPSTSLANPFAIDHVSSGLVSDPWLIPAIGAQSANPEMFHYPPGEATISNPMTMQRMHELQFDHAAPSSMTGSMQSPNIPQPADAQASGYSQHECQCGPACLCSGCAAHPFNQTSMQEIKEGYLALQQDFHDERHFPQDPDPHQMGYDPGIETFQDPTLTTGPPYASSLINGPGLTTTNFAEWIEQAPNPEYHLQQPNSMGNDDYFVYEVPAADSRPWLNSDP